MGTKRKYTPSGLKRAVERYFKSISRERVLTEPEPTGELDKYGHEICRQVPVVNALGEPLTYTEYLLPPSVGDLSIALGIHRSTWNAWCDHDAYPEFTEITTWATDRMHAYLSRESLTRSGKDLKGVLFNLENNYGYKERQQVVVSGGGIEEFLQSLADRDDQGGSQF